MDQQELENWTLTALSFLHTMPRKEAESRLMQMHGGNVVLQEAIFKDIDARIKNVDELKDPPTMAERHPSWYAGPDLKRDKFWPAYRQVLSEKLSDDDLRDLDDASTKVVSKMQHPGLAEFKSKGLVIGYVQSGKTSNFTAVIAKAADAGYRMFIVMSGMTNKLRIQTQLRIERDLRNRLPDQWFCLTEKDADFRRSERNAEVLLQEHANHKVLCVIKKNTTRLKNLKQWLAQARPATLKACPILIIDDEADQGSINTAKAAEERKSVNRLIVELLRDVPKVAYVGYTATPFANVFIDSADLEDLYPRDFIVSLKASPKYFGPERIFGRRKLPFDGAEPPAGLDMIRPISAAEAQSVRPKRDHSGHIDFAKAPALNDSILYFCLATAARRARGQADHSTMLVHTTARALEHFAFFAPIEKVVESCRKGVESRDAKMLAKLRELWQNEMRRVDMTAEGLLPVPFEKVLACLPQVLAELDVVVENYLATPGDRIDYESGPKTYIVIGGNILSRGLTLEGLVVSYFVRSANAYDTLLQMGRWFGYREGFEDLPRIWATSELAGYFMDMARVEKEIRQDILRYEQDDVTPREFAPRIRTHPDLMITSPLRMRHAVSQMVSFGNSRLQTTLFKHKDQNWLRRNFEASRDLFRAIAASGVAPELEGAKWAFRGVESSLVREFLGRYQFHEEAWAMRRDVIDKYIAKEIEAGSLAKWNVVCIGRGRPDKTGELDIGLPEKVRMIVRSRIDSDLPYANVRALMSGNDPMADLESGGDERDWNEVVKLRNLEAPKIGLLLVYPIDKLSKPEADSDSRVALDAADNVVGVALVFPQSERGFDGVVYKTANIAGEDLETTETPDDSDPA